MWKTGATVPKNNNDDDDDDWETDPDYVNNMSEEQQRWGGERDGGGAIKWDTSLYKKPLIHESFLAATKNQAGFPYMFFLIGLWLVYQSWNFIYHLSW